MVARSLKIGKHIVEYKSVTVLTDAVLHAVDVIQLIFGAEIVDKLFQRRDPVSMNA